MTIETFLHLILHALKDSALVLPFLLITYIIIEFIQRRATKLNNGKFLSGKLAPLYASCLGLFPQCGFSIMSSKLYENNLIKAGTLLAVFIATSDEAFALLISSGNFLPLLFLLLFKLVLALIVGFSVNAFIKKAVFVKYKGSFNLKHEEYCRQCGTSSDATKVQAYLIYPLIHALKTFAFVLVVNFIFGIILHFIGEDNLLNFMQTTIILQPIVCALVGLIPNCASSILITQLFIKGGITFGSMFAGLSANAGIGLAVILKDKTKIKNNLILVLILYLVSITAGFILNIF